MADALPTQSKMRLIPSTRFTLALLVSFALFIQYAQRVSLSMAIVCMVDRTPKSQTTLNLTWSNQTITETRSKIGPSFINERRFPWNELQQQILLGAYWFGYIFTLVPSKNSSTLL